MKKIFNENKYLSISFITFVLGSLMLGIFKVKNIPFVMLSIALNIFVILLFKLIIKKLNIKFSKREKILITISIILIYLFYFISILGRKFIYYWDYSCYYNLQTALEKNFNISLISGIRNFVGSTWSGEYGNFLNFFPEFIFNFSSKTINSYVLCCVVVFVPYLIVSFSILIKKLNEIFKVKKEKIIFPIITLCLILFPIFHATFIYGQPDIFGLAFIFLIIALTIDYDFSKIDYERLSIIGILTYMLLISRRWYMYFIITYYLCYGLSIIISNFKDRKKLLSILKHAFIYLLIVGVFFGVTLFPLFKNILVNGYNYEYYMSGGFKGELISQLYHLGFINLIIILIGLFYGLINKKYTKISIFMLIQYFLIIFIFTRMQNMGLHHSLLLVHIYIYCIYMFILFISSKKILLILLLVLNVTNLTFGLVNPKTKIFTDVSLVTPKQDDYDEVVKVGKWLKKNLKNNKAYMITHNDIYNPDKFRNLFLPDETIKNNLPYGSAIIGVHTFPIEILEAKYIITSEPFVNTSIEYKYNDVLYKLVEQNKFKKIKEFDMKNSYKILIYERLVECDKKEIDLYKNELKDLSDKYPNLYIDILNKYEKKLK